VRFLESKIGPLADLLARRRRGGGSSRGEEHEWSLLSNAVKSLDAAEEQNQVQDAADAVEPGYGSGESVSPSGSPPPNASAIVGGADAHTSARHVSRDYTVASPTTMAKLASSGWADADDTFATALEDASFLSMHLARSDRSDSVDSDASGGRGGAARFGFAAAGTPADRSRRSVSQLSNHSAISPIRAIVDGSPAGRTAPAAPASAAAAAAAAAPVQRKMFFEGSDNGREPETDHASSPPLSSEEEEDEDDEPLGEIAAMIGASPKKRSSVSSTLITEWSAPGGAGGSSPLKSSTARGSPRPGSSPLARGSPW
jgi:hypothetical protein